MAKKTFKGQVVSNKMQNTVVVAVDIVKRHPLYTKMIKNTKRFKAHTENELNIGDEVVIQSSKPYSKEVSWEVTSVIGD